MDARAYFKDKKVTLMRIGLLGRGIGDAAFLARCGARVLVVDDASQEQMQASVDALKDYPNISFKFGPYDLEDFKNCDLVLKGAGTRMDSPEIAEAHARGIPVRMSADLFTELSGILTIGVTGTRGKSATTHLIHAILEHAGKKVLLGGNVRGISTLALLDKVQGDEIGVMELDSWQLQGFGEARLSPNIGVFTTFFPDHLNYYKDSMVAYLDDKAQIFLHQKEDDTLILGTQTEEIVRDAYRDQIRSTVVVVGEEDLPGDWKLKIPGAHNRYNAALALAVARAVGIDDTITRAALETFAGVPGRLEFVRSVDGVAYYNDTTATTPEATVAALTALQETVSGGIVLITGGADKSLDMSAYVDTAKRIAKRVIFLNGTGTERVRKEFPDAPVFDALKDAFEDARAHASSGDAVILSPAFASFGMFKNEYDRGDQWNALVNAL